MLQPQITHFHDDCLCTAESLRKPARACRGVYSRAGPRAPNESRRSSVRVSMTTDVPVEARQSNTRPSSERFSLALDPRLTFTLEIHSWWEISRASLPYAALAVRPGGWIGVRRPGSQPDRSPAPSWHACCPALCALGYATSREGRASDFFDRNPRERGRPARPIRLACKRC